MDALTLSLPQAGLSLAAGSLTTLSPCVFPLLPLVLGGAVQAHRLAPLAMGAGMAASFAGIGLLLGAVGPALGLDGEHVRTAGGALLLAFAVVMLVPALNTRFTQALAPLASTAGAMSQRVDAGSLWGALLLGGLLGLVWSPCSGPLLGLFGLGAAIPLVAVAYASRRGMERARGWVLAHAERVKKGFGLLLGAAGLAVLSGADKWLEARVLDLLPETWVRLTTMF